MKLISFVKNRFRWSLLILLLVLITPALVFAQATDRQDTFVYGINAGIPDAVVGTFAPPVAETIYILSTETSLISPRITSVYYWPITNDYRASWNVLNEVVEGELEILSGLQTVETVEQTIYTIHFHRGQGSSNKPTLYIGTDAEEAYDRFQAEQLAYQEDTLAYDAARKEWIENARLLAREGVAPDDMPPGPDKPLPFNTFSTGLNSGFPVKLEAGNYRIRTRAPDGTIVPESERSLIVFEPRRTAVGYEVVPEQRWTFPEQSNELEGAILGADDTVVYLKPFVTREYPTGSYARLQDPQDATIAQAGEWTWVAGEPINDATMEQVSGGRVLDQIPIQAYAVKQTPGSEFGYDILEYDSRTPDVTPRVDFIGYRVPLTGDSPSFSVRLRSADDTLLVGSDRAIRVGSSKSPILLGLISLLPLLVGGCILWRRQQQTSRLKAEGSGAKN